MVDGNGRLTETEEEAATALNKYYHSVFTADDGTTDTPDFPGKTHESLSDITFMVETVEDVLLSRDKNKAAGPDGVENRLKECAGELAPILNELFRRLMDAGEVPELWKEANIVLIHKTGSKAKMSNFRPVALTSVISKVCEKILCDNYGLSHPE